MTEVTVAISPTVGRKLQLYQLGFAQLQITISPTFAISQDRSVVVRVPLGPAGLAQSGRRGAKWGKQVEGLLNKRWVVHLFPSICSISCFVWPLIVSLGGRVAEPSWMLLGGLHGLEGGSCHCDLVQLALQLSILGEDWRRALGFTAEGLGKISPRWV